MLSHGYVLVFKNKYVGNDSGFFSEVDIGNVAFRRPRGSLLVFSIWGGSGIPPISKYPNLAPLT